MIEKRTILQGYDASNEENTVHIATDATTIETIIGIVNIPTIRTKETTKIEAAVASAVTTMNAIIKL